DDKNILRPDGLLGELAGAKDGFLEKSRAMEGVGPVAAEQEIRVEAGGLQFDARAFLHIARAQPQENILPSGQTAEQPLDALGKLVGAVLDGALDVARQVLEIGVVQALELRRAGQAARRQNVRRAEVVFVGAPGQGELAADVLLAVELAAGVV